ncbi:MAG: two-component regulator propeller domain-containing protein, partial [Bacteroidota bacterium]
MRIFRFFFFLVVSFTQLSIGKAYAQEPVMWHLTGEDGLPSMWVYDILQDSRGFIWLATQMGLCRYDGSDFELIPVPESRNPAISHLSEDSQGRIWFDNFVYEIFYYDPDQQHVQPFVLPDSVSRLLRGHQSYFYRIDRLDNFWLTDLRGFVWRCDLADQSWKTFDFRLKSGRRQDINLTLERKKGILVMINDLNRNDPSNPKRITRVFRIRDSQVEAVANLKGLFRRHFSTSAGHFFTNDQKIQLRKKAELESVFEECMDTKERASNFRIMEDHSHHLWVISANGAWLYNHQLELIPWGNSPRLLKEHYISSMI